MSPGGVPDTRYLKVRGAHLACQVFGEGPRDIVLLRTTMNHLEAQWEEPRFAAFMRRLASFARVITFDQRGMGMSDPIPAGERPGLDMWSDDLVAVMDELGCERASIVCCGPILYAFTFVASHPQRVDSFVPIDASPTTVRRERYPFGPPPEMAEMLAGPLADAWGTEEYPLLAQVSSETKRWLARYQRLVASPGVARASFELLPHLDVSHLLDTIHVPTLVIAHAENAGGVGGEMGRALADAIPGATYRELPGQAFWFWGYDDPDLVGDEVEMFITGSRSTPLVDRILTTVLFTDIVGSTERASQLGDAKWRGLLDSFDAMVTQEVDRFRGRVVKSTGDGHLATFDAPGRGIHCAGALLDSVHRLDLRLRAGLHTGEVELRGEDLGGMAVHIGRRICDAAGPDEILVSASLPVLVAGSGIGFDDRGARALKGVPGEWQLFAAAVSRG